MLTRAVEDTSALLFALTSEETQTELEFRLSLMSMIAASVLREERERYETT